MNREVFLSALASQEAFLEVPQKILYHRISVVNHIRRTIKRCFENNKATPSSGSKVFKIKYLYTPNSRLELCIDWERGSNWDTGDHRQEITFRCSAYQSLKGQGFYEIEELSEKLNEFVARWFDEKTFTKGTHLEEYYTPVLYRQCVKFYKTTPLWNIY